MKKILLALGTVAAVIAPVATVVSCDLTTTTTTTTETTDGKSTVNGIEVTYSDDQVATIDFKGKDVTVKNLEAALRVADKKVIDSSEGSHTGFTTTIVLKSDGLDTIDGDTLTVELNNSSSVTDEEIEAAVKQIVSDTKDIDGWKTAFAAK